MADRKPNLLRNIADHELAQCFHDLDDKIREELAVSLVRQWLTFDGVAVLVTREFGFRFDMKPNEDGGATVTREVSKRSLVDQLRKCRVAEQDIPALIHEINLCQAARYTADDGTSWQMRVDPGQKKFFIELVREDL